MPPCCERDAYRDAYQCNANGPPRGGPFDSVRAHTRSTFLKLTDLCLDGQRHEQVPAHAQEDDEVRDNEARADRSDARYAAEGENDGETGQAEDGDADRQRHNQRERQYEGAPHAAEAIV